MFMKVRLPQDVSDEVDEDPTGNKALWDRGLLNGASEKVHLTSAGKTTAVLRCILLYSGWVL